MFEVDFIKQSYISMTQYYNEIIWYGCWGDEGPISVIDIEFYHLTNGTASHTINKPNYWTEVYFSIKIQVNKQQLRAWALVMKIK